MLTMTTDTNPGTGALADTDAPAQQLGSAAPETDSTELAKTTDATPESGDDADKSLKRMQRRIDRVTAARYQAEARAQQLAEQLAQYQHQPAQDALQQPADIEQIASQRADEIAEIRQVTARGNAVFADGVKAYGREAFQQAVELVNEEAGPLIDQRGRATSLGEAILDADKPAALIQHLAQNPDVADGLRGLSPAQIGRRIARIEAELSAKPAAPKPSSAPKPITPVRATSAPQAVDPSDTKRWIEARNAAALGRR